MGEHLQLESDTVTKRGYGAPKPPGVSTKPGSPNLQAPTLSRGRKRATKIAMKIAYRNGGGIGIPKGGAMDCTMVAAAPVLPAGYVVSASRIADRRMIRAGYRLADLLTRVVQN
jgi:hypothetical protein